jgi:large subunit ribosomal protein L6
MQNPYIKLGVSLFVKFYKMSNIGKKNIYISPDVSVKFYENFIIFLGYFNKLKLECKFPLQIVYSKNMEFSFIPKINYKNNKNFKSLWGSFCVNLKKLTHGITYNFHLRLKLFGVGFKIFKKQDKLVLKLGFSHKYFTKFPFKMVFIKKIKKRPLIFLLKSSDFFILKNISVFLRSFKKPESYKGKGFSFRNELLVLKEGKKVK